MDFRDKVFLVVAENLSFTKASEELLISQPAITKQIKELESKLKISLFERKGNKVYLTKAGKVTYTYLKKIEQQYRELEFEIGRLNQSHKGELRIGASSTISQYLVPKVMAAFHKRFPKIELFLFNGNSFEMEQLLINSEIDLALVENSSSQTNIKYQNFLDDELIVVTGAKSIYAKFASLSVPDFKEIPLILREKGSGTLEVIKKTLQNHNMQLDELNTLIHLGSTEAIKDFLTEFDGIALVSEKAVEKEFQLNRLKKITVKGLNITRKFRIATLQGQTTSTAELFIQFILNYNY